MRTIKLLGAVFGLVARNMVILLALIAESSRILENVKSIIISFLKSSVLFFVPIVQLVSYKLRKWEYRAMPISWQGKRNRR
jgi:hypothetical protein